MQIPSLAPDKRNTEYNRYTDQQRDKIVYYYLFVKGTTNRNIDEELLGLDPIESKGYQSMGILHHLGLKSPHKCIFVDYSIDDAINLLIQQDAAHYKILLVAL